MIPVFYVLIYWMFAVFSYDTDINIGVIFIHTAVNAWAFMLSNKHELKQDFFPFVGVKFEEQKL